MPDRRERWAQEAREKTGMDPRGGNPMGGNPQGMAAGNQMDRSMAGSAQAAGIPGGGMPTDRSMMNGPMGGTPTGGGAQMGRAIPGAEPGQGAAGSRQGMGPVRTAEEEEAYRLGQRMGTENNLRSQGIEIKTREEQAERGVTKERLRDADRMLMKYKAGKNSVDRRIIHAQQWWKLRNWNEIEAERGTKGATEHKSATAWLWNCIVGKHADAIDSFPEPIILPRMQDDKEEANRLSEIVPVVMAINGFEDVYSQCQWQKMQEGTAAYGVFWDKTKLNGMGDIGIRKINLLNLFWEPGINDIQESRNLFYVSFTDNDQLEQMYPQLKGKLKTKRLSIQKYRTDDSVDLTEKSAVVDWYYHKWDGPRKVLHYCKYVGDEILYSTENNGEEGLYDDGNYPFVLDPLFPVEGSPCGYGYIDIGKDAQADIDTLNQAMVLNAAANATPRHFVRKDGAINEEEFCDFSKPIVHVNGNLGEDSLRPIQTNVMSGNAISMLQQKIDELKFVTGNTDVNNGGTPAGVTAASAIAALKEDSGKSSKDSTKSAYRAYGKIVTMVIERIRQFYDIPRQFRILGQDGQEEFTSYSNAGLAAQAMPGGLGLEEGYRLPAFDIEVRAQRENAYTKMSQNELALQFYNSGMFNPQMSDQVMMCLDMMDFRGKDEVKQKVQRAGTMQETLIKVGQIALALAQKYQPEVAEELSQVLQQAVIGQSPMPEGGKAQAAGTAATRKTDPTKGAMEANESSKVREAREQTLNATRPD